MPALLALIPSSFQLLAVILGPLLLGGFVFYKGWAKGRAGEQAKQQSAKEQLDKQINEAVKTNLETDAERNENIAHLDKPLTPQELLDGWKKLWGPKE